ncbi:MAG: bifunctional phosphopantothenoylcysteine decarboxylase/phosphopantothenate--cysteine ligase CoaBC, partial [Caulobacterales bacterium]|nr:bifunctional phosphopantothenoylcysteine decarboxylase/phosphopantothenate--cysteine ligase CoaBC [Caulobacterales bacterium]
AAGKEFVTPLSVAALSGETVYDDLFSLTDETEMGHIELSRSADLLVVAPATADLMAKAASGLATDMATTALLATDKPVMMAPAMNVRMWEHPATQRNLATLRGDGVLFVGPDEGDMACGEFGLGRMAEPVAIADAVEAWYRSAQSAAAAPLAGRRALVTAGPTREPLDPVRYLSNHSSGRQGYAVAAALARLGAETTLVTGPTALAVPAGVTAAPVETAEEMLAACRSALPADVFVAVAAVADWRPATAAARKIKKSGEAPAPLALAPNPDILAALAKAGPGRPELVVGFAAETNDVVANARAKLTKKNADWIVANDVSGDVMGGGENEVVLVTASGDEAWPRLAKGAVADRLAERIAEELSRRAAQPAAE